MRFVYELLGRAKGDRYNGPMRVVIVSKALIVGTYQTKAEAIARLGVDLTVLVPPSWRDRRGAQGMERGHTQGYALHTLPLWMNGNYHLHFYPTLARWLKKLRPDIVHMDEEPYNLATWLGIRAARAAGAQPLFFTWQNILRRYPLPFRRMEQANYAACAGAIAGSQEAASVLRRKGYTGTLSIIPQFGVDPDIFTPPLERRPPDSFHIGYAGGLIHEKGVDLLLRACAGLQGEWRLTAVGSGDEQEALMVLAQQLGIRERVTLGQRLISQEMPNFYRSLDVLVLPSRTQPNWKEQFGRVLIEAMACGVPVIGSDCGEIPNVIGPAGMIFAEEEYEQLTAQIQRLINERDLARSLAQAGRERVMERFTMSHVAQETVKLYQFLADR